MNHKTKPGEVFVSQIYQVSKEAADIITDVSRLKTASKKELAKYYQLNLIKQLKQENLQEAARAHRCQKSHWDTNVSKRSRSTLVYSPIEIAKSKSVDKNQTSWQLAPIIKLPTFSTIAPSPKFAARAQTLQAYHTVDETNLVAQSLPALSMRTWKQK